MTTSPLPLVIEPDQLQAQLDTPDLLIVDLCKPDTYAKVHIPGAVHLGYAQLVAMRKPVMGLLPDEATLSQLFSHLGLTPDTHVIAYDEEGGGAAARLLWTLDTIGHHKASLLNGGLHAWLNEAHPVDNIPVQPESSKYKAPDAAGLLPIKPIFCATSTTTMSHCSTPAHRKNIAAKENSPNTPAVSPAP